MPAPLFATALSKKAGFGFFQTGTNGVCVCVLAKAALLLLLSALSQSMAQEAKNKTTVKYARAASSMAEAASQVQAESGGKVLSIKRMQSRKGEIFFRVKVLTADSRVRVVLVPETKPAATARTAATDQD
jgi:starvation-inducible outer membrane lipoprotein